MLQLYKINVIFPCFGTLKCDFFQKHSLSNHFHFKTNLHTKFQTIGSNSFREIVKRWFLTFVDISITVTVGGFSTRRFCPKKYPSFVFSLFFFIFFIFCTFLWIRHHLRYFSNSTLDFFKIYFRTFVSNGYCFVRKRVGVRN